MSVSLEWIDICRDGRRTLFSSPDISVRALCEM